MKGHGKRALVPNVQDPGKLTPTSHNVIMSAYYIQDTYLIPVFLLVMLVIAASSTKVFLSRRAKSRKILMTGVGEYGDVDEGGMAKSRLRTFA